MRRSGRTFLLIVVTGILLLVGNGCSGYTRVPKSYSHFWTGVRADLPDGWVRYNPALPDWVMTRDGLQLENIKISVKRAGSKVEGSERRYQSSMMPHEIAELSLALLKVRDEVNDLEIESIDLVTIAERDGYFARATFEDDRGLTKRLQVFGAMIEGYVCEFWYIAEESIYYDKHRKAFEEIISTVHTK
jgi:hypothetical protein